MRVLFWSDAFWPSIGGVEVLGARLVLALRDRGYDIAVVADQSSPDLPAEAEYQGGPIYRLPFARALRSLDVAQVVRARQRVAEIKRQWRPELVHIYFTDLGAYFHWETAAARPTPTLATLHGAIPVGVFRPDSLLARWIRPSTWVVAGSSWMLGELRRAIPDLSPRSSVVHNALPATPLAPRALRSDPPRLLCLGRLTEEKGFDLVLAALRRLVDRCPRLGLIIAGDGPLRRTLERRATELGLMPHVDFLGWVSPDDVPALINAATVVVVPSSYEAFGLVALQAAQMGRPVVATRVGGLAEIVEDGVTGLLVESGDATLLAAAIAKLLDDPAAATRMARAARRRARERFSWGRHVDAYDALYRSLARATT